MPALFGDVQGEGGFAHTGAGGEDDELAGVEPAGQVVEIEQARRDAGDGVAAGFRSGHDEVHRVLDDVLEREGFAADLVLGDAVDLVLGGFEELLGGELVRITVADDLGGAFNQLAVGRFFLDDAGVVDGVGGGGDALDDFGQDFVTADGVELLAFLELFGEGDGVDGLVGIIKVSNCGEDELVGIAVEVIGRKKMTMSWRGSLSSRMLPSTLRSASRFWGGRRSLGDGDAVIGG